MQPIDDVKNLVRRLIRVLAVGLNTISDGRVTPNTVTTVGLLAHIPIAYLIAIPGYDIFAGVLLIIFGLFDTLDGELARLQGTASATGMFYDASTDRMKEVFLLSGVAYAISTSDRPAMTFWAVAACGASLCVSYVKAKGEAALATGKHRYTPSELNRVFKDGLLTFEIRMLLLVIGLFSGRLTLAVVVIAILASFTAVQRLIRIMKALRVSDAKA